MELVIALASFLAVVGLTIGLGLRFASVYTRLESVPSRNPWVSASPLGVPLKMLAWLNLHPQLDRLRTRIEQNLQFAGQPGALNAAEYLGVVELCGMATFVLVVMVLSVGGAGLIAAFLIGVLLSVAVSWCVYVWLDHLVAERRVQIARQFPYFLDLAVMTMEAGCTFEETVAIYVQVNPKDVLSEELRLMLNEIQMGKRRDAALAEMREHIAAEEVRHVINAVLQRNHSGTPLGQVLREQADAMRFKRSQLAERAAEELKIRMMGPTVLMMIALLMLILGPAFINAFTSGIL